MKVFRFQDFMFESYTRDELKTLLDAGLITQSHYNSGMRTNRREDFMKDGDPITVQKVHEILNTEGAKKLMAMGLHHVSSKTQLENGNMAFSLDPNYHSDEGWAIGFYSGLRTVKRLTPKRVKGLTWRRAEGSMDIPIRKFSNEYSDLEFFDKAMAWAADHINFDISQEDLANPSTWKYYVKNKSKRDIEPNQR